MADDPIWTDDEMDRATGRAFIQGAIVGFFVGAGGAVMGVILWAVLK